MKTKKLFVFSVALVLVFAVCRFASAQKEEKQYYEDCKTTFDMNAINLRGSDAASHTHFLHNYSACRAAAKDNINKCANLLEPNECKRSITSHWFYYGRLILRARVTPAVVDACVASSPSEKDAQKGCKAFAENILKNDASSCAGEQDKKRNSFCSAVLGGNPALCPDDKCRDIVNFVTALKELDVKKCDKISAERLKWICKGGITGDEAVCQKSKDVGDFKESYCRDRAKKEYQESQAVKKFMEGER